MSEQEDKLWESFSTNARAYKVIDFPRYDDKNVSIGKICLRTLLMTEIKALDLAVADEVDYQFKKDSKTFSQESSITMERFRDRDSNIRAEHYLQAVIVHPDNKDKLIFPTPMHVSKSLSLAEAQKIMAEYGKLQEGRPQFTVAGPDDFNKWTDALVTSAETDQLSFLGRLDTLTLLTYTQSLVSQLSNLRLLNSSLITQVNVSETNTSVDLNLETMESQ